MTRIRVIASRKIPQDIHLARRGPDGADRSHHRTGLAEDVSDVVAKIGVPARTMASTVAFAVSQPDDVDVNEILFRPTIQPV